MALQPKISPPSSAPPPNAGDSQARLEESSRQLVAAASEGDLPALARALEVRAQALACGAVASQHALQCGEDARELLELYIRALGMEAARVKQLQDGLTAASEGAAPCSYVVNTQG